MKDSASVILQKDESHEFWNYDTKTDKTHVVSYCPENYPTYEEVEWEDFAEAKMRLEELLSEGWKVKEFDDTCPLGKVASEWEGEE